MHNEQHPDRKGNQTTVVWREKSWRFLCTSAHVYYIYLLHSSLGPAVLFVLFVRWFVWDEHFFLNIFFLFVVPHTTHCTHPAAAGAVSVRLPSGYKINMQYTKEDLAVCLTRS